MRRRFFTLLAALSLLLFLATIALWVRSCFFVADDLYSVSLGRSLTIDEGWITVERVIPVGNTTRTIVHGAADPGKFTRTATPSWRFLGAEGAPREHQYSVSLAWPTLIFAAVAMPLLLDYRKRARMSSRDRHGRCVVCGYDLRASPERCPECGLIPAAKANAKMNT